MKQLIERMHDTAQNFNLRSMVSSSASLLNGRLTELKFAFSNNVQKTSESITKSKSTYYELSVECHLLRSEFVMGS